MRRNEKNLQIPLRPLFQSATAHLELSDNDTDFDDTYIKKKKKKKQVSNKFSTQSSIHRPMSYKNFSDTLNTKFDSFRDCPIGIHSDN